MKCDYCHEETYSVSILGITPKEKDKMVGREPARICRACMDYCPCGESGTWNNGLLTCPHGYVYEIDYFWRDDYWEGKIAELIPIFQHKKWWSYFKIKDEAHESLISTHRQRPTKPEKKCAKCSNIISANPWVRGAYKYQERIQDDCCGNIFCRNAFCSYECADLKELENIFPNCCPGVSWCGLCRKDYLNSTKGHIFVPEIHYQSPELQTYLGMDEDCSNGVFIDCCMTCGMWCYEFKSQTNIPGIFEGRGCPGEGGCLRCSRVPNIYYEDCLLGEEIDGAGTEPHVIRSGDRNLIPDI